MTSFWLRTGFAWGVIYPVPVCSRSYSVWSWWLNVIRNTRINCLYGYGGCGLGVDFGLGVGEM